MKKENVYNVPLLEINVSLYVDGWRVLVNTNNYCEKKRLGHTWFENKTSNRRIYLQHIDTDNPGYSPIQERIGCLEYSQIVRPEHKDRSIEFLKSLILDKVSGWERAINKMMQSAKQNETIII